MQVKLPGQILEEVRKLAEPVRSQSRLKFRREGRPDVPPAPVPPAPAPIPNPRAPTPPSGAPQPTPPAAPSQPQPPQVIVRPVTTSKFLWKFTRNLATG